MPGEDGFGSVRREVVDLQRSVVTGRHVSLVVGRKGQISNGLLVRLDMSDIVEVGLPELDHAVMVAGDEPFLAVRVYGGSDRRVMGSEYGLEIERHAIPQCELSVAGGRQQSPTFRCP